ncbi:TetR/AcrR family transcriptional regulator [Microlunatus soli]|uniref:DNA-binding transcriptional regulator, AcrR family n=1 Tax=Microlunatus soli TaxID=630515 RepID=A0A1H2A7J9_9ACTN|nr:TetR/AcrR family transcriptional regulator [Microlunatus soli]SDT41961.1 DNA-binding transcriptional regulator, AcrR family [Microlunatus soli]
MTDQVTQKLRVDARENRDRVVEAARELFAERGIDVTMRAIARRAGVGPATLYRRFPAKQQLVDEAFADEMRACRGIVEEGCDDLDPWRGFCSIIERITVLNARNQGFVDAFLAADPEVDGLAAHRRLLLGQLAELAERAQRSGGLRRDFVIEDLLVVLLTGRALSATPRQDRESTARRFAALAIDAFRASADHGELPSAGLTRRRAG